MEPAGAPVVITAAIVGGELTRQDTPHLPLTPVEIACEAARCRDAGAAMVHVHARDAEGRPTQSKAVFAQILAEIRARTDVLVQVSTGGSVGMSLDERLEPLDLDPDMATLTAGSVNFGDGVFLNTWPMMAEVARRAKAHGITPEIEVFDAGMLDNAKRLIREGLIPARLHYDFVLGVPGGLAADEPALDFLIGRLPAGCTWSVAGIGKQEIPMARAAAVRGGHIRVGLEDNIFAARGVLAKGSSELVQLAVQAAAEAGRRPATPAQAREPPTPLYPRASQKRKRIPSPDETS